MINMHTTNLMLYCKFRMQFVVYLMPTRLPENRVENKW